MPTAQRAVPGHKSRNAGLKHTVAVLICPTRDLSSSAVDALAELLPLGMSPGARERLLKAYAICGSEMRIIALEKRKTAVRVRPTDRAALERLGQARGFEVMDHPSFDIAKEAAMREDIDKRSASKPKSRRRRSTRSAGEHYPSLAW